MNEIEQFLNKYQFYNVDITFCSQYHMFLIVFVREDLKEMVGNIN